MDFASLLPSAARFLLAQAAARTPDARYHAADCLPLFPGCTHPPFTQHAVASMIALGSARELVDGDTMALRFAGLTRAEAPQGTWRAEIGCADLPTEPVAVPSGLRRLEGEALVRALSTGINGCTRAVLVHPDDPLGRLEKSINGQPLHTLGIGLMHLCCTFPSLPAPGFSTTFALTALVAGQARATTLTTTLTRVA